MLLQNERSTLLLVCPPSNKEETIRTTTKSEPSLVHPPQPKVTMTQSSIQNDTNKLYNYKLRSQTSQHELNPAIEPHSLEALQRKHGDSSSCYLGWDLAPQKLDTFAMGTSPQHEKHNGSPIRNANDKKPFHHVTTSFYKFH